MLRGLFSHGQRIRRRHRRDHQLAGVAQGFARIMQLDAGLRGMRRYRSAPLGIRELQIPGANSANPSLGLDTCGKNPADLSVTDESDLLEFHGVALG